MIVSLFGGAARRAPVQFTEHKEAGIAGTLSLYTETGPIPAVLLFPGDKVIRRGKGPATVRSVAVEAFSGRMIRIAPDALGRARPEDFVLLPPDQKILLRHFEGTLIGGRHSDGIHAARDLVDNDHVAWYQPDSPVQLVRLGFDAPEIIHAGGLELEIDG